VNYSAFGKYDSLNIIRVFAHIFISNDDNSSFLTLIERVRTEIKLANDTLRSNDTSSQEHIEQSLDRLDDIINNENYFSITSDQLSNRTVNALLLANTVDDALRYYGEAFGLFPAVMTNMSNMMVMTTIPQQTFNNTTNEGTISKYNNDSILGNQQQNQVASEPTTTPITDKLNDVNRQNISIVDQAKYDTSREYVNNAVRIFESKLKSPSTPDNINIVNVLEDDLFRLKNAIDNKSKPMNIMMIVHTEIYPNLQAAFDLKLKNRGM
jgi:hypothetical protein